MIFVIGFGPLIYCLEYAQSIVSNTINVNIGNYLEKSGDFSPKRALYRVITALFRLKRSTFGIKRAVMCSTEH